MYQIEELTTIILEAINKSDNIKNLEKIRIQYLGKKGILTKKIQLLHSMPINERRILGQLINISKKKIIIELTNRKIFLEKEKTNDFLNNEKMDITLPGRNTRCGKLHPIIQTIYEIELFFNNLGFNIVNGLEIENSYYNFDALNIPENHPARTEHDTFWFDEHRLLRTQTSSIQNRIMKKYNPPLRFITSGRVYRNDYDRTHTPMFHQIEGLMVEKNISFANLKWILSSFLKLFFEKDIEIRFRPSYFPFTEPSAEVDIMRSDKKWLEVLGCGMVHPKVLKEGNIDSNLYSGIAFGMGVERLTMLRYKITDLRIFFENDVRFLKQFH
ncbi:phenylalanine--tRNA ligase subunit alpha [Candidatus Tachikawaea gelatinosa]|uniref:Phenylalanine--tRNA ligase alpha subunit n=1 Tax=Candidatus Tachikawaea gelatinosa TaxID=1410383 RepID=A0A090ARS3_9ENTR|nr:phenylalanine--tRNA ligase subunit alpha [Candidatus Tachikawaea gelatinosa]BAP58515.1 phenylalanine--tRNA ligase alpha subunit [Candidatus Tachikawaea gelatinosa]